MSVGGCDGDDDLFTWSPIKPSDVFMKGQLDTSLISFTRPAYLPINNHVVILHASPEPATPD